MSGAARRHQPTRLCHRVYTTKADHRPEDCVGMHAMRRPRSAAGSICLRRSPVRAGRSFPPLAVALLHFGKRFRQRCAVLSCCAPVPPRPPPSSSSATEPICRAPAGIVNTTVTRHRHADHRRRRCSTCARPRPAPLARARSAHSAAPRARSGSSARLGGALQQPSWLLR